MRALSDTTTSDLVETAVDISLSDISEDTHPYRTWIWFGVFAAGAGFWFAVGLGIHALMR